MKKGGTCIQFVILEKQVRILVFQFQTILTGFLCIKKNLNNLELLLLIPPE